MGGRGLLCAVAAALMSLAPVSAQYWEVAAYQKVGDGVGGFAGTLDDNDQFGKDITRLGDLDGDGVTDVAVGAVKDDDGGTDRGAVWVLFLNANGTVKSSQKISDTAGSFSGTLADGDMFGGAVAGLGDLDNNGTPDLAVGAAYDSDGGTERGAVWILFLNTNGTVASYQKISNTQGGFSATLNNTDRLGYALASLGDLDGDGVEDLAVGTYIDDDGGTNRGGLYILFLNTSGTVKSYQKISDTAGNFTGTLDDEDRFGSSSLANLGDLDSDGVTDLAVPAYKDDDGGADLGAVWILFMKTDGTVKGHRKISATQGGLGTYLDSGEGVGGKVSALGDLDSDGVEDLAIGYGQEDDGGTDRGAVRLILLNADGTVKQHQEISDTDGGFGGTLANSDALGSSVSWLGDMDGNGMVDVAAAALGDDGAGTDRGAVWMLFLRMAPPALSAIGGASSQNNPLLDWSDIPGITSYTLQYDDDSGFTGPTTVTGLTASQYSIPTRLADGTYYWRVKSVGSGESPYATADSFAIIPALATATILLLALAMGAYTWHHTR